VHISAIAVLDVAGIYVFERSTPASASAPPCSSAPHSAVAGGLVRDLLADRVPEIPAEGSRLYAPPAAHR